MTEIDFGLPLPSNLEYAVSFGIPTWNSAIGYAEKDPKIVSKMRTGYPRYFPQPPIQKLCDHFIQNFGQNNESCRPFPSLNLALQCLEYVRSVSGVGSTAHIAVGTFTFGKDVGEKPEQSDKLDVTIAAVLASDDEFEIVREYWKLRGECVSSRLAVSLSHFLNPTSFKPQEELEDEARVVLANKEGAVAKDLIRKRIIANHCKPFGQAGKTSILKDVILKPDEDVHLVSSGMSSIFTVRKLLTFWEQKRAGEQASNEEVAKSLSLCNTAANFGFPFKDTQVILKALGKSLFFGYGDSSDVKRLKEFLSSSQERILAVFIETPSNPLLNMPDLEGLRRVADEYGFFIVIDDTIGGLNVDILGYADIVCTSLTKLFNGSSNVMGGSIILNPKSSLYSYAREYFASDEFEDLLWCEDAIVLEVNSRDFEARTVRANENTGKLLDEVLLPAQGKVFKKVYYPTVSSRETYENYEAVRNEKGGYGCLFSIAFYNEEDAAAFYDSLKVYKGPSNGTNFTLACPYVHLAHHSELEEVSKFGADPNLIRVSVGLEDTQWLLEVFSNALEVVRKRRSL